MMTAKRRKPPLGRSASALLYAALLVFLAAGAWGCDRVGSSSKGGGMMSDLTPSERKKLDREVEQAESESYGLVFYKSSYKNMNIAGLIGGKPFALIAGSHESNFPFFGDRPWDNGLLLVGGEGYGFTHRTRGRALDISLDMGAASGRGSVSYDGKMTRLSDGTKVDVTLDVPLSYTRYPPLQLGKPYVFLDSELSQKFVGMRWQPFEFQSDKGTVQVAGGATRQISGVHGELEYGILANLRSPRFAFTYDYVNLAKPGTDGYAFVDYTANPVDGSGVLGTVLREGMKKFASATVTMDDGHTKANTRNVVRPPQSDGSVVLFENEVDLQLAVLKRQMIKTTDADGDALYGLREIFVPK